MTNVPMAKTWDEFKELNGNNGTRLYRYLREFLKRELSISGMPKADELLRILHENPLLYQKFIEEEVQSIMETGDGLEMVTVQPTDWYLTVPEDPDMIQSLIEKLTDQIKALIGLHILYDVQMNQTQQVIINARGEAVLPDSAKETIIAELKAIFNAYDSFITILKELICTMQDHKSRLEMILGAINRLEEEGFIVTRKQ